MMKRIVFFLAQLATIAALFVRFSVVDAQQLNIDEAQYRALAFKAIARFNKPSLFLYAPASNPKERAAVTVAVYGHALLAGFIAGGPVAWRDSAKAAADSLVSHADMNHDGRVGWGRYWPDTELRSDGAGGITEFGDGCKAARSRAYDDELYDDARITDFLLDLYGTVPDHRYFETAQSAIENTWDIGGTLNDNGFGYWKTAGACSRGWSVKNVNMLMAIPIARLAKITKKPRYHNRLQALMIAERKELQRTIGGRSTPNFGYYTTQTTTERAGDGRYIERTQVLQPEGAISCNPVTGSGRSCLLHVPLEARSIALADAIERSGQGADRSDAITLMNVFKASDTDVCQDSGPGHGLNANATPCVAYYCALRKLDASFDRICHDRIALVPKTVDIILGLLWSSSILK